MRKKIVLFGDAEEKEKKVESQEVQKVLIEDIYLIHRGSGKLMQRKTWRIEGETDPDMVAGMFEAILNFITDSFARGTETKFSRFDIKGYTVLLSTGKTTNLAVVLSLSQDYTLPDEVFAKLKTEIENCSAIIEERFAPILDNWDGDVEKVKETRNLLEELSINLNHILAPSAKMMEISDRIFQEAIFELQRKADLALKKRKYSMALSMLEKSIAMGYAPPDILFKKAKALYHCRKYAEAKNVLESIEESMGKTGEYILLKAMVLNRLGRKNEALEVLATLLASSPDHKKALQLRKEIERKSGG